MLTPPLLAAVLATPAHLSSPRKAETPFGEGVERSTLLDTTWDSIAMEAVRSVELNVRSRG